ncbi:hypothetical protein IscW_ISCW007814, partial [Ixodes scapularis]
VQFGGATQQSNLRKSNGSKTHIPLRSEATESAGGVMSSVRRADDSWRLSSPSRCLTWARSGSGRISVKKPWPAWRI